MREGYFLFYDQYLEEVIFDMHNTLPEEPDRLLIISGYLGPDPVFRLKELPFPVTIVAGMYTSGVNVRLYDALQAAQEENPNLEVLFATREVHSKIYIWLHKDRVLTALVGSANFSANGLRSDLRETLTMATRGAFPPLMRYFDTVIDLSTFNPSVTTSSKTSIPTPPDLDSSGVLLDFDLPLYSPRQNKVAEKSGLNWGHSSGHTAVGDAYIAIPKDLIAHSQSLIEPFDDAYESPNPRIRKSDPIELIWDDGTIMSASLEGEQTVDGLVYPKQLTSYSSRTPVIDGQRISVKSILGRYLRNRMGIDVNRVITLNDLDRYGRRTVTLKILEPGVYSADFSV